MPPKASPAYEIFRPAHADAGPLSASGRALRASQTRFASDALGAIDSATNIFVLTDGSFSLIDVIDHCLTSTGPGARVTVATWAAAWSDLVRLGQFRTDHSLTGLRVLIDPGFFVHRDAEHLRALEALGSDNVRSCALHAKFVSIESPSLSLAIRTSMNLNRNKRLESLEITACPRFADFLARLADPIFAAPPQGSRESAGARKRSGDLLASLAPDSSMFGDF